MVQKPKCSKCGKIIVGKIKLISYQKKLGRNVINVVEYYDEKCFLTKNKERSLNECSYKERIYKKKNRK